MMEKKTVTLRTLTPLFIKGKDPGYGEAMLRGNDGQIYLIDNDELCEYLARENKIEEYVAYYHRTKNENYHVSFAKLYGVDLIQHLGECQPIKGDKKYGREDAVINGISFNRNKYFEFLSSRYDRDPLLQPDKHSLKLYKELSLRFFLEFYNCMPDDPDDKNLKVISKGIMPLEESKDDEKFFIQDVNGNYYLPGSSIKGAIRNALFWSFMNNTVNRKWLNDFIYRSISKNLVQNNNPTFRVDCNNKEMIGDDGETLDRKSGFVRKSDNIPDINAEYKARWKSANEQLRDVLKALKISDSQKLTIDSRCNVVVTAVCMQRRHANKYMYMKDFDIELHAISSGFDIPFTITLDTDLLKRLYGAYVPFCLRSIDNLLITVEKYFFDVYQNEQYFFSHVQPVYGKNGYEGCDETQEFYNQKRENLFRLGWGCGLMTKSQFLLLDDEYNTNNGTLSLKKLIRDKFTGRKKPNDSADAPKSRCLIIDGTEQGKPLGWCELVYEKKKYHSGDIIACIISSFEAVTVEGRERCRPLTVRIEGQEKEIPVICEKTSKNELQAKNLFSEVKITAVDEKNQIIVVTPIFKV